MFGPSQLVSFLTLFTFSLGFAAGVIGSLLSLLVTVSITITLSYKTPKFNHLEPLQLFYCLLTTYVFGIVDGYIWNGQEITPFGIFLVMSTIRYYGEFQLINSYHHSQLQWHSFLIYHSKAYTITNIFLLVEHLLTLYVFDFSYKKSHFLEMPSIMITLFSLFLRIAAFFTAKSNFTHKVSYKKKFSHQLVTNGVYSIFRHPSYTGFFYYSIFSMVLIGNFISAIMFGLMLSVFFDDRIQYEEMYLQQFFGQQYKRYKKRSWVLIPFLPKFIKAKLPQLS